MEIAGMDGKAVRLSKEEASNRLFQLGMKALREEASLEKDELAFRIGWWAQWSWNHNNASTPFTGPQIRRALNHHR